MIPEHIEEIKERTQNMGHLAFLSDSGSRLYGTHTEDSDWDYVGFAIPTRSRAIYYGAHDSTSCRTSVDGERSTGEGFDAQIHHVAKFAKLIADGNPNMVSVAWGPFGSQYWRPTGYMGNSSMHLLMLTLREQSLTKAVGKKCLGYMRSQHKHLLNPVKTHRTELLEQFGFDTKYAMHLIRLGIDGIFFMEGAPRVPLDDDTRDLLVGIRNGAMPLADIIELAADLEEDLKAAIEASDLPERADHDKVAAAVTEVCLSFWRLNP